MAKERPKEFLTAFGKRLAELRKSRGMTQEQLAEATDLHRTYIGFIEQGKRDPTIGNVYKLAKALSVGLNDIFEPFGKR